jgi:hypothetical protein
MLRCARACGCRLDSGSPAGAERPRARLTGRVSHEHATAPVYPFGAPGAEIVLWEGDLTVGDKTSSGRLWMTMTGGVSFRWALDPAGWRSLRLGETRLAFEHPDLGPLNVPARVTSTAGSGIFESTAVGTAAQLDELVVHWVNVPSVEPAEPLESRTASWSGRWSGCGGGWSFVLDAREDHTHVVAAAKDTPFCVVTHTGTFRRTGGQQFTPAEAEHALAGLHVALSFALGRWVAPTLATGFVEGRRVWELWSTWRCEAMLPVYSWWDTHTGDDLRAFVSEFLDAWVDPDGHDVVRHVAHHIVEANKSSMTLEARVMLAGAAMEYLSWVTFVIGGLRTAKEHKPSRASDNLRELLVRAGIPINIPGDLDALARLSLPTDQPQDGPAAIAWVRNKLVHPKDAREPYRLKHVLLQTWQLLMNYSELLLLHEVGYTGAYCVRFPLGQWAHDSQPVPWAAGP